MLRLYENIWKTRQKIVYNDQVKIGHLIHYIQDNENSKRINKNTKKKKRKNIGFELSTSLSAVGNHHHYATASLSENLQYYNQVAVFVIFEGKPSLKQTK